MRACRSTGISLTLLKKDKEEGEKKKRLECMLQDEKIKVVLNIVDRIAENMRRRGILEEPGFHIERKRRYGKKENRYEIYLTKERFKKLTNPDGHPVVDGGFFVSRSMYDRISFNYYGH